MINHYFIPSPPSSTQEQCCYREKILTTPLGSDPTRCWSFKQARRKSLLCQSWSFPRWPCPGLCERTHSDTAGRAKPQYLSLIYAAKRRRGELSINAQWGRECPTADKHQKRLWPCRSACLSSSESGLPHDIISITDQTVKCIQACVFIEGEEKDSCILVR